MEMEAYIAKKTASTLGPSDPCWERASVAPLTFTWPEYSPIPYRTEARLVHSDEGVTVRLSSTEWPLRALSREPNTEVCEDSCMEFFFIPSLEGREYINIEVNPFGIPHVGLGEGRCGRRLLDISGEGLRIETAIRPGEGWSLSVFIPYTFIDRYFGTHTDEWRVNFYKCGDLTVKEHYATWSKVGTEAPDYHRPEFFGKLILSQEAL